MSCFRMRGLRGWWSGSICEAGQWLFLFLDGLFGIFYFFLLFFWMISTWKFIIIKNYFFSLLIWINFHLLCSKETCSFFVIDSPIFLDKSTPHSKSLIQQISPAHPPTSPLPSPLKSSYSHTKTPHPPQATPPYTSTLTDSPPLPHKSTYQSFS